MTEEAPPPAPPGKLLGKIELTQQPEKVFYKDEGGQRWYYLFVFFVVRGRRTPELKRAFDKVADGRRKIPVDCLLLYDHTMEEVEDQTMLQLLGSSREESEVSDGTPEFDPGRGTGSIRYRINKVSMRKDNQGFRLRIKLRGLEDVIAPAVTEPTQVLSKRKRLRKSHRAPEQQARNRVETQARKRNDEVEEKMARENFTSTPLIHRILSEPNLVPVPDYPDLKITPENGSHDGMEGSGGPLSPPGLDLGAPAPKRQRGAGGASADASNKMFVELDQVKARLRELERHVQLILGVMQQAMPSYGSEGGQAMAGSSSSAGAALAGQSSLPLIHETLTSLLKGFSAGIGQDDPATVPPPSIPAPPAAVEEATGEAGEASKPRKTRRQA